MSVESLPCCSLGGRRSKRLTRNVRAVWTACATLPGSAGALAIVDQAIVSFANFGTNALVAHANDAAGFGVYFMALSLLYFVRGFQEQLIAAPLTVYHHRRNAEDLPAYIGNAVVQQTLLMVVTWVCLAGLSGGLAWWLSPAHRLVQALHVLLAVVPFFMFREFIRKVLFAEFRFRLALVLDTMVAVLQLAGVALLFCWGRLVPVTAFAVMACSTAVAGLAWLGWRGRTLAWAPHRLGRDWRENWRFGRWALMTHLVGCSTPYLMPWVVASLRGEAVTGLLGASQTVVGMANMFVTGVSNFLSPRTAQAYVAGGPRALLRTQLTVAGVFVLTLGGFTALVFLAGDWLGGVLMGAAYSDLSGIMTVLALALLAGALGMTAGNGLWAMDRPSRNLVADWTSLVVTLGTALLWVPTHGALGAAYAWLTGNLLSAGLRWWIVGRMLRQRLVLAASPLPATVPPGVSGGGNRIGGPAAPEEPCDDA